MHREVIMKCMDVDDSEEEWRGTGKLGGSRGWTKSGRDFQSDERR